MEAVSITNCKRSGSADAGDYPNIAKQTVGELKAAGLRARVETFTCECTITTDNDVEEKIHLQMQYVTTNATNRTYTWVASSSSTTGETVPDGLAAAILAERSGELRAERMTVRCGDSLPQLGDRCDGLFLTQIEIDCAELTADCHFGAPEFLSVDDMASLLSNFRNKRRTTLATSRVEGKPDDGAAEVEMGPIPPLSSTEFAPGKKAKTTIASSSGGGSISLNPSELEAEDTITVHKFEYKQGDEVLKELKFLATEDMTLGQRMIFGGDGIEISSDENGITISLAKTGGGGGDGEGEGEGGEEPGEGEGGEEPGEEGSGYSGSIVVATDPRYDEGSHQLLYTPVELAFENGRLSSYTTGSESVIAQAVEESA
jgi:hypothetical protein